LAARSLALLDLCALLEIRAELAVGQRALSAEIRSLGFHDAPDELFAFLAARVDQTRAVLRAFIFEGKVTLDLLSKAVIETIGPARGFGEKHDDVGTRLDSYADAMQVAQPPIDLVERARELEERVANVRDYVLVHPKMEGGYARAFVHPIGSNLEINQLYPDGEGENDDLPTIDIDELANQLALYARGLMGWVASVVRAAA
jgi:hypothetical protein